jgi:hypothetical protein
MYAMCGMHIMEFWLFFFHAVQLMPSKTIWGNTELKVKIKVVYIPNQYTSSIVGSGERAFLAETDGFWFVYRS